MVVGVIGRADASEGDRLCRPAAGRTDEAVGVLDEALHSYARERDLAMVHQMQERPRSLTAGGTSG